MLADDQHGIDRQLVASASQRLGNRRVDLESELLRPLAGSGRFRESDPRRRRPRRAAAGATGRRRVAHQEPFAHVPGVRVVTPLGRDDRHPLARSGPRAPAAGASRARPHHQSRAGRTQERSSRDHVSLRSATAATRKLTKNCLTSGGPNVQSLVRSGGIEESGRAG